MKNRQTTLRIIAGSIAFLVGSLFLDSCSHSSPPAPPSQQSIDQRLSDLERQINGSAPQVSGADAQKEYEHDLVEIRTMGLVDRAQQDFNRRIANATIENWRIGYFVHTNTVWCDFRYHLPGGSETLQQEFGYTLKTGTNWSLMWGVGAQPE